MVHRYHKTQQQAEDDARRLTEQGWTVIKLGPSGKLYEVEFIIPRPGRKAPIPQPLSPRMIQQKLFE